MELYDVEKSTKEFAEKLENGYFDKDSRNPLSQEEIDSLLSVLAKNKNIGAIRECKYLLPCGICDKNDMMCSQFRRII